MIRESLGSGFAGSIGFLLIFAHLRCCDGEAGFAQNASIAGLVIAALLVVAIGLQGEWRRRPIASIAVVLAWSLGIAAIMAAARPSWDHYVYGRDLHLALRAAIVFFASALLGLILHQLAAAGIDERPGRLG